MKDGQGHAQELSEDARRVVQFTVSSAEELRVAQAHPEKYEDLQVRICGWNVRWNDLPKREQDAYILRTERISGVN